MPYSATDLDAYVRQTAPQVTRDVRRAVSTAVKEADLVDEIQSLLEDVGREFDVTPLHLQRERTLVNGRADAVYNRFVVEYEPPHSLRANNTHRNNRHAIEQVTQYLEGLERLDRHSKERLAGAVLDGSYYIFVRYRDGQWHVDDPVQVDNHSTETFLRYLLSLSAELALTPEHLMRDFGENSNTARRVVPALYHALEASDNAKVRVLFRQWQRQFREISGYDPGGVQLDAEKFARLFAVRDQRIDLEQLLFAVHTYYAAFIKLLALQVAQYYLLPRIGTGLSAVATYPSDELRDYLAHLERGGLFADLHIRNFLEGDFFGWYLDIWDDSLDNAIRRLIADLGNYSLITLDVDPEETRDLLKHLYQNLMPKKLRHALGEYYTPDWLAEHVLNQLGYDGDPSKRILDPACGSGTFLVLTIKRIRQHAESSGLEPHKVIEGILRNVVGYDLNPLAVMTARTNYLLALGDLLSRSREEIRIPVYLADSILTPSQGTEWHTAHTYSFTTSVGRFSVPRTLVDAHYIDQLAELLEECVHNGVGVERFQSRLLQAFPLDAHDDEAQVKVAITLYKQLLALEQEGIDGIWARIIKNAFAPLFQGQFDYVAGNPPWVNWESLPAEYRSSSAELWRFYGMAATKGKGSKQFALGKQKRDISALMTYVALDKYLTGRGRLSFLITQSLLKTAGSEGFRRFSLPNKTPVKVVRADDMVALKPFEGASNRTAIVVLEKGQLTEYPVPYFLWYKPDGGAVMAESATLTDIIQSGSATCRQYVAEPVDRGDLRSPWISGRPEALRAIKALQGSSDYEGHLGVNALGGSAVYWVQPRAQQENNCLLINNLTEGAKRKVETVQATVEKDLVLPLLRSGDVKRWNSNPSALMIVPHTPDTSWHAIPEDEMQRDFPRTYAYLRHFREHLLTRSGYKLLRPGHPFYILGDIHTVTFADHKVAWARMASRMEASVVAPIEGHPVIPQETVTFVACADPIEAHYVCAVLNSVALDFAVQSYSQAGGKSFGTPGILRNVRIPKFDPLMPLHKRLVALSQQAHHAAAENDANRVQAIEMEIDKAAAQIWGLTDDELHKIQESEAALSNEPAAVQAGD